jgi:hypothetical protein
MNSQYLLGPALGTLLGFAATLAPCPVNAQVLNQFASQRVVQEVPSARPGETVSSSEVEKYVAVYDAMHRNRKLTLQQAAAAQGLSVAEFRDLEQRVEQNQAAREQARGELMKRAEHRQTTPNSSMSPTPSQTH